MVKVEIVDEKETSPNSPYASSSSSRTSSSVSLSSVSSDLADESLVDRIAALVDIVPPTTRHSISTKISKVTSAAFRTGQILGNVAWVVATSALLIGLPLVLVLEDEARIVQQEKEDLARQQGAQTMMVPQMQPGGPNPMDPTKPKQQGIVPPGF